MHLPNVTPNQRVDMSTRYSSNKDLHRLVADLVKHGWTFRRGKTHGKLISPRGGWVTIPSSPSDSRAYENCRHDIQRLETYDPDETSHGPFRSPQHDDAD